MRRIELLGSTCTTTKHGLDGEMKPHAHVYIPNGASEICVHCGTAPAFTNQPAHIQLQPVHYNSIGAQQASSGMSYTKGPWTQAVPSDVRYVSSGPAVAFSLNGHAQPVHSVNLKAALDAAIKRFNLERVKSEGYPWLSWEHEQFEQ